MTIELAAQEAVETVISHSSPKLNESQSSGELKSGDELVAKNEKSKSLTINCANSNPNSNASVSSKSSTSSISPISNHFDEPKANLKRSRDTSYESTVDLLAPKSCSSPQPPPAKAAKVSYSIMNILGKESSESSSQKMPPNPSDLSAFIQHSNNPFLMNPFLAAAAAYNQQPQQQHQQSQMPWLNMAAMSALYGLDSKFFFLYSSQLESF